MKFFGAEREKGTFLKESPLLAYYIPGLMMTSVFAAAVTMVMMMVMIAVSSGIVRQGAGDKSPDSIIRTAGDTGVKFDAHIS